jgi:hypothetical protein
LLCTSLHFSLSLMLCRPKVSDFCGSLMNWLTYNTGLDCTDRLFISDRAHLVFDFHQIVDGLKEVELGGSRYFVSTFLCNAYSHVVVLEPLKKGLVQLTLAKLLARVFVCTTCSITNNLLRNSAKLSRVSSNIMEPLNMTPKVKYRGIR